MVADITIFDPKSVTDNSDCKAGTNGLPSTGIPYVLVDGQFVVKNNKAIKVMAGQQIRFPVENEGRFVPANTEQWLKNFSIDSSPLASADPAKPEQASPACHELTGRRFDQEQAYHVHSN